MKIIQIMFSKVKEKCTKYLLPETKKKPRSFKVSPNAKPDPISYPSNKISNQKYSLLTFVPLTLYQQFKFFLNLFFLLIACTQFFDSLRVGDLLEYWGPLSFLVLISLFREGVSDIRVHYRDRQLNNEIFFKFTSTHTVQVRACDIKVGDRLLLEKNRRIPADVVFLKSTDPDSTCYVRTDQLDGETDWKIKIPLYSQIPIYEGQHIFDRSGTITLNPLTKNLTSVQGMFHCCEGHQLKSTIPLTISNMIWANSVVLSNDCVGVVAFTGSDSTAQMNLKKAEVKVCQADIQLNDFTKLLFAMVFGMAFGMVSMKGFAVNWHNDLIRFVLLFSYIIPMSVRVNLDLARSFYNSFIENDQDIEGAMVRSFGICEDMGRISYLLCDKTGTITKNVMALKLLHLPSMTRSSSIALNDLNGIDGKSKQIFDNKNAIYARSDLENAVKCLALCNNVQTIKKKNGVISFEAASPDELGLLKFTETMGMEMTHRSPFEVKFLLESKKEIRYQILHLFPFTPERKRMGVIVKCPETQQFWFIAKGSDCVMSKCTKNKSLFTEAANNMAIEGLRTLVVAKKVLSKQEVDNFNLKWNFAFTVHLKSKYSLDELVDELETDLEYVCVTGVDDKLQEDVPGSISSLRNAGIKLLMLTGDKMETAVSVAKSAHLIQKRENVAVFSDVCNSMETSNEVISIKSKENVSLVISGDHMKKCIQFCPLAFVHLLDIAKSVICYRCSPQQKADMAHLLKKYRKGHLIGAIGDGGNDVSMIRSAHIGIGIDAHEGKQASLAADFSVLQFKHIVKLFLVHGRYCYKRTSLLSQFIIHRGIIISFMQAIFCASLNLVTLALYPGLLFMCYTTLYTVFPVLALITDKDVKEETAMRYPELYLDLKRGKALSYKTFTLWILISIYQDSDVENVNEVRSCTPFCRKPYFGDALAVCINPYHYGTKIISSFYKFPKDLHFELEEVDDEYNLGGQIKAYCTNLLYRNTSNIEHMRNGFYPISGCIPNYASPTVALTKNDDAYDRNVINFKITPSYIYGLLSTKMSERRTVLETSFQTSTRRYQKRKDKLVKFVENEKHILTALTTRGKKVEFRTNETFCTIYYYEEGKYVGLQNTSKRAEINIGLEEQSACDSYISMPTFLDKFSLQSRVEAASRLQKGFKLFSKHGDIFFENRTNQVMYMQCYSYNWRRRLPSGTIISVHPGITFCCQSINQIAEVIRVNEKENFLEPYLIEKMCQIRLSFYFPVGDRFDHQTMSSVPFFVEFEFNNCTKFFKDVMAIIRPGKLTCSSMS
uniref:Phospholipid-transporting ATPase n=1 Tax=Rhabditophanes sp. KR3021 TaxID=114890 RepID=A0AC35TI55_9BILA